MNDPTRRSPAAYAALVAFVVLGTIALILGVLYVAAAFLFAVPQ